MNDYTIYLWNGYGYFMSKHETTAYDEMDALEKVVSSLIKEQSSDIYYYDVNDLNFEEYNEWEDDERYLYLDLSSYDLSCYYILFENAIIMEVIK